MMAFRWRRGRPDQGTAVWILIGMFLLVLPAGWAIRDIRLFNDVRAWLPTDDPQARVLAWYHRHFPEEDRILISWEGSSLDDPRVEELAVRLTNPPAGEPYVKNVVTPQSLLERMEAHHVDRDEGIARLEGVLVGRGPLRVRLTNPSEANIQRVCQEIERESESQLGLKIRAREVERFETDTEADHHLCLTWDGMQRDSQNADRVRSWLLSRQSANGTAEVQAAFFRPGSPVAISVMLSDHGVENKAEAFAAIRRAGVETGIPEEKLCLGGRPVAGYQLDVAVREVGWNSRAPLTQPHRRSILLLCAMAGAVLAWVMLRSIRLALMVMLVTFYAIFLAVAVVPLSGGSMNMVLVVMPTLLMVLTLSCAIHVANYWRHAVRDDSSTAFRRTMRMAWLPCLLASGTTAIGLLSLGTSPLVPVHDFGVYSAVGCLLAFLIVLFGLPALLNLFPGRSEKRQARQTRNWNPWTKWLCRHRNIIAIVSCLAFFGCLLGLSQFRTETRVIRYFPDESRIVKDYQFIEENLAGVMPVEIVVRFDEQACQDLNFLERMELVRGLQQKVLDDPRISGALSLADFQPVIQHPDQSDEFSDRARYNIRARRTEKLIRTEYNHDAGAFYSVCTHPDQLGDGRRTSVDDELWRITAHVGIMDDVDFHELTDDLHATAAAHLEPHTGTDHAVTGLVPLFMRTQDAVMDSLVTSFGLAFLMIAVVMMLVLRSVPAGLITMLPNLLPIGVVFGFISWCGVTVDLGTMITASVGLGIAVDGTLHLLTWFRSGLADGLSRPAAISRALSHCGPAMWQTGIAVGLGLLVLLPSELLLISRFGWLMCSLVGVALIGDLILLPALLAGPLGAILERGVRRAEARRAAELRAKETDSVVSFPSPVLQPLVVADATSVE